LQSIQHVFFLSKVPCLEQTKTDYILICHQKINKRAAGYTKVFTNVEMQDSCFEKLHLWFLPSFFTSSRPKSESTCGES